MARSRGWALFTFLLALGWSWAAAGQTALITFTSTNSLGQPDTNYFRVIPVGNPILANGAVTTKGAGIRLYPNGSGIAVTNLMAGNYLWTNAWLGSGIVFAVPKSTNSF